MLLHLYRNGLFLTGTDGYCHKAVAAVVLVKSGEIEGVRLFYTQTAGWEVIGRLEVEMRHTGCIGLGRAVGIDFDGRCA